MGLSELDQFNFLDKFPVYYTGTEHIPAFSVVELGDFSILRLAFEVKKVTSFLVRELCIVLSEVFPNGSGVATCDWPVPIRCEPDLINFASNDFARWGVKPNSFNLHKCTNSVLNPPNPSASPIPAYRFLGNTQFFEGEQYYENIRSDVQYFMRSYATYYSFSPTFSIIDS